MLSRQSTARYKARHVRSCAGVELQMGDGNDNIRTRGALPKGTTRK